MIIKAKDIVKTYVSGTVETQVLRGIDFEVMQGSWTAIMGKSGAGKSTLLYQLSLLDHPTSGSIVVDGVDINTLKGRERTQFRLDRLGYVFQDYALLPELTALENVLVPLLMQGVPPNEAKERATGALQEVGLAERTSNLPGQLSGGEQQRVSIARAVAQEPTILFADEPTANLDSVSSQTIIDAFARLHKKGQTIVMVTHEKEYTTLCDKIVYLEDGKIVKVE